MYKGKNPLQMFTGKKLNGKINGYGKDAYINWTVNVASKVCLKYHFKIHF